MTDKEYNIPDGWKQATLGDVLDLKNGYAFKSETYTPSGIYNIITIKNVQGQRFVSLSTVDKIDVLPSNLAPHQHLKPYDILVSLTGNNGRVSYNIGGNNLLNQRVGLLELLDETNTDKEFVFQLLSSSIFQSAMENLGEGAAQKNLKKEHIMEYKILVPPFPEQRRIASILSNLDDLIEKQAKIIEKKKRFRDGMLRKFIIGPEDADEHPNEIADGNLTYWSVGELGEVLTENFMGRGPVYVSVKNDCPCLGQAANQVEGIDFGQTKYMAEEFYRSRPKSEFLRNGDIIINSMGGGSVGRVGYIEDFPEQYYLSDGNVVIARTNKDENESRWFYYVLSSMRSYLENDAASGSTNQTHLLPPTVAKVRVPIPPLEDQRQMANTLALLDKEIKILKADNEKNQQLKAGLLRKLITGEIWVA